MVEKYKVGIVGLGLVATPHFKGYSAHPHADVTAICDLDRGRATAFAGDHGIPQVFTSYDEMLDSDIDVVDIATPTFLHAPMTKQAAEAGKHIHCEKPFCRSVAEGTAACAAVRDNGVKLVVGETYVFISSHRKARELIEAGEIGRPLQIRERHGDWLERPIPRINTGPSNRSWRIDGEQSGGGAFPWIFDHTVHFFAAAEYFMLDNRIEEIYALQAAGSAAGKQGGAAHDPYATAEIDIPIITWKYEESDRQGVWMRAERLNGKYDFMRGFSTTIIGEKGMIEVLGEGGGNLLWNGEQQHLVLHREGKETACFRFDEGGDDVWQSDISYYSRGHIEQVHHLIDCIAQDREPRYKGEDGVRAVKYTLAAILSAQEGRPVKVADVEANYTAYT